MKKIKLIVIFIFCMLIGILNVNGIGKAGTGCKYQQLDNMIKNTSINQNDKICIYKNSDSNYDEYYPVQFEYSTETGTYRVKGFNTCSELPLYDNRDSENDFSCDKFHIDYDYESGFFIKDGSGCSGNVNVCFEHHSDNNLNPEVSTGKTCKIKDQDIEFLNLTTDGDYSVILTNKGNVCPATTEDMGLTYTRITLDSFDCNKIVSNWKIVDNKDSYTYNTCRYYLVDKNTNISNSFNTEEVEVAGDLVTTYLEFNNSNAAGIRIIKNSDGTYKAMYKSGQQLTELSSDTIKASIDGKTEYPKYLFLTNSNYVFGDTKPDNVSKTYININYLNNMGTGLGEEQEYKTCEELFGDNFLNFLNDYIFKIIWIGVPILLILLTSFDFAKVVFSDDKDGMKKSFDNLKKRAIAAILIFLTPTIIIIIMHLVAPDQITVSDCVKTIRNMSQTQK